VNGVSGTAIELTAGTFYTCAIQAETGSVICWGNDEAGQATPSDEVNGVSGSATQISAGANHTLAIELPEPSSSLALLAGSVLLYNIQRIRAEKPRRLSGRL
jgi:hypothetical protein